MIYILVLTNLFTAISLVWLLRKHLDLLENFDSLNEKIENSLDAVESSCKNLSKLLKTPVLFDDPIVVEMVQNAKNARNALLATIDRLAPNDEE
jgi:hypothetical protein